MTDKSLVLHLFPVPQTGSHIIINILLGSFFLVRTDGSSFFFLSFFFTSNRYCLTTIKTQTINNYHADAISGNRASYMYTLSSVGRILGTKKMVYLNLPLTLTSGQKNIGCMINKWNKSISVCATKIARIMLALAFFFGKSNYNKNYA